ncbi:MAG: zinc-binding dehydrogenase [Phycisphaerae bacterium]
MKVQFINIPQVNQAVLTEKELDETLKPSEVIVKAHYAVTSAGTDTARYSGMDGNNFPQETGAMTVGEIIAKGAEVNDYKVGDRVACLTPNASHVKCDTLPRPGFGWNGHRVTARVPDSVSLCEATIAYPYYVSMAAVRESGVALGEETLVVGGGMIGNTCAQLFQCAGASVLLADLSEKRLATAQACGIRHVVQPGKGGVTLAEAVQKWTQGRPLAQVVFAIEGGAKLLADVIPLLGHRGNIVLHGGYRQSENIDAHMFAQMQGRCQRIITTQAWGYFVAEDPVHFHHQTVLGHFRQVMQLIAEKRVNPQPLISMVRPKDCQQVFQDLIHNKDKYIAAVYDWTSR